MAFTTYSPSSALLQQLMSNSQQAAQQAAQQAQYGQYQHAGTANAGGGGSGGSGYVQVERLCTAIPGGAIPVSQTPSSKETKVDNSQMIPDISLSRVFKWAVVFLIGLALGRRVWDMFGDKLTKGLSGALDHLNGPPKQP